MLIVYTLSLPDFTVIQFYSLESWLTQHVYDKIKSLTDHCIQQFFGSFDPIVYEETKVITEKFLE